MALTRKAAAAVSVGTYSACESTATLRLLGGARGASAPTREEKGATCTACSFQFSHNVKYQRPFHLAACVSDRDMTKFVQTLIGLHVTAVR